MQLILNVEKPTIQTYFEKKFQNPELEWEDIYTLPRRVTINTNLRIFQYKLLHNVLYLNEMLYKFGKNVSHFVLFARKNLKAKFTFFILAQRQTLCLDAATTFYPKCINNPSNYTTEPHPWICCS